MILEVSKVTHSASVITTLETFALTLIMSGMVQLEKTKGLLCSQRYFTASVH